MTRISSMRALLQKQLYWDSGRSLKFEYMEHIAVESSPTNGDDILNGFVTNDGGIKFTSQRPSQILEFSDNVLLPYTGYTDVAKQYWDALFTPGFIACGYLTLKDHSFFETCALPVDIAKQRALMGEPLCWGGDFAQWYSRDHNLDVYASGIRNKPLRERISDWIKGANIVDEAVILSAPGQEIYGHWLLDFLPRLDVLTRMDIGDIPIYSDRVPAWADYFLDCFGIDRSRLLKHPARMFKVKTAHIPASAKSGYRLGASAMLAAWQRVMPARAVDLPEGLAAEKIFLSRKRWAQSMRPSVDHIDALEAAAVTRGYKIIEPETLGVPEQIALMREARFVIGEDGSALHNIIFAKPGARLGVISRPDRCNLWHYGLCHITGQQLAYCFTNADQDASIAVTAFHDFVDVLES